MATPPNPTAPVSPLATLLADTADSLNALVGSLPDTTGDKVRQAREALQPWVVKARETLRAVANLQTELGPSLSKLSFAARALKNVGVVSGRLALAREHIRDAKELLSNVPHTMERTIRRVDTLTASDVAENIPARLRRTVDGLSPASTVAAVRRLAEDAAVLLAEVEAAWKAGRLQTATGVTFQRPDSRKPLQEEATT